MKNSIIIFSLLVACATAFLGCSKDADKSDFGPGVTVSDNDFIIDQEVHTSPRLGQNCETGKLFPLPQPRLDSVSYSNRTEVESIPVLDSYLRICGYRYFSSLDSRLGNGPYASSDPGGSHVQPIPVSTTNSHSTANVEDVSSNSGMPSWLKDLQWFLLAVILIGLVVWFVFWLYSRRPNLSAGNRNADAGADRNNAGNGGAGGTGFGNLIFLGRTNVFNGPMPTNLNANTDTSLSNAITNHIKVINELQKTGGESEFEFHDENIFTRMRTKVEKADSPATEQASKTEEK